MRKFSITAVAAVSLAAIAAAGCTTTGIGTGQSAQGNVGVSFNWTESVASRGNMVARLTDGRVFQGPYFQITSQARLPYYDPLWYGWGPGWGWHRPWGAWGSGWGGWGPWGPSGDIVTQYSGQVLANLQGPGGFMRCRFSLARPTIGLDGGGAGQCQLPDGSIIYAQFPMRR
ncbi:MAG TPA: hypothetical protein VFG41_05405 [Sphingomicrobium sp.]|nr:hypothetical protein [Sphingomicrobium sp.]